MTNPRIDSTANMNRLTVLTELLIGRVALTSINWQKYWVVGTGAYSLNNLRLGFRVRVRFRVRDRVRIRVRARVWIVWYMEYASTLTIA